MVNASSNGSAYGIPVGEPLNDLVLVGQGTPYGEVLRRYWHPIALSEKATTRPSRVKVLGEELILFRTRKGQVGLLTPRCIHRGASLFYGGVEDEGIRCCYHGWVFDTEGNCLEQPCEPEGGLHKSRVRQPWYPVQEQYGMVWAYMGPPDKQPVLPRYDSFEDLGEGEMLVTDDTGAGGGGPELLDFNWLQHWENVMDPFHVPILHARFSGNQFTPEMSVIPTVDFEYTTRGVRSVQQRDLEDGRRLRRVTEVIFPNLRVVPSPRLRPGRTEAIGWVVPEDDTSFRILNIARTTNPDLFKGPRATHDGKRWNELTDDEHQQMPGDYEAQKSQGDISLHTDDHLTTTDQGVAMIRRMMAKQLRALENGDNPAGVAFDEGSAYVRIEGGNFFLGGESESDE